MASGMKNTYKGIPTFLDKITIVSLISDHQTVNNNSHGWEKIRMKIMFFPKTNDHETTVYDDVKIQLGGKYQQGDLLQKPGKSSKRWYLCFNSR